MTGGDPWQRRRFLATGTVAIVLPGAGAAQPADRIRRLAVVVRAGQGSDLEEPPIRYWRAWRQEMRRLGYVEGQNLSVDRWSAEGDVVRIRDLLREVMARKPDVIFAPAQNVVELLQTSSIAVPVVCVVIDPVGSGMAASLARPGGMFTGVSLDAGLEILSKRFAILKEAVPRVSRIACLMSRSAWESRFADVMRDAATGAGLTAIGAPWDPPVGESELRRAFASMLRDGADCFYATVATEHVVHRSLIAQLANEARLPGIYTYRENVEAGGLIAYTIDLSDIFRRAAGYVDRLLKGARPGDLPFDQPTKFELVVNLEAARKLGLTIPQQVLLRADEVIE